MVSRKVFGERKRAVEVIRVCTERLICKVTYGRSNLGEDAEQRRHGAYVDEIIWSEPDLGATCGETEKNKADRSKRGVVEDAEICREER